MHSHYLFLYQQFAPILLIWLVCKCFMYATIRILHKNCQILLVCSNIKIVFWREFECWEGSVMNATIVESVTVCMARNHNIYTLILATLAEILPGVSTSVP